MVIDVSTVQDIQKKFQIFRFTVQSFFADINSEFWPVVSNFDAKIQTHCQVVVVVIDVRTVQDIPIFKLRQLCWQAHPQNPIEIVVCYDEIVFFL